MEIKKMSNARKIDDGSAALPALKTTNETKEELS
jgi:hypothetical protein